MPYLGNAPAEAYSNISYQDLTGGSGTTFTLDFPAGSPGELEVFVNNVRQEPSVAYTVSGTTLTMTGTIATTDDFYVVFQGKAQQTVRHPANTALEATTGTFSGALSATGAITSSGGIYLGGTASTNLLDNYVNDGTWSPYFSDINGNAIFNESPTVNVGTYQRIGDFVTVHTYFGNPASVTTTASYGTTNQTYIAGLPFAVPSGNYYAGIVSYQVGLAGSYDGASDGYPISIITEAGYSVLRLHFAVGATMAGLQNQYVGNSTAFILSCTYKVA